MWLIQFLVYVLLLLFAIATNAQPLVEGGSGKVWNKKKEYSIQDGATYKYTVDSSNDTARYFNPGDKKYEITVTAKEIKEHSTLVPIDVDDTSTDLIYTGTWYKYANQAWTQVHHNKTVSFTSVIGASVATSFTGGRFEIWCEKAKNKGTCEVWLKSGEADFILLAVVDLYQNTTVNNSTKVFDSGVLPYGNYVVKFSLRGLNASSTEANLLVDKFVIYK